MILKRYTSIIHILEQNLKNLVGNFLKEFLMIIIFNSIQNFKLNFTDSTEKNEEYIISCLIICNTY